MEKKLEPEKTGAPKEERVPNIKLPIRYDDELSKIILDYQCECNAILKGKNKELADLRAERDRDVKVLRANLEERSLLIEKLEAERDKLKEENIKPLMELDEWLCATQHVPTRAEVMCKIMEIRQSYLENK